MTNGKQKKYDPDADFGTKPIEPTPKTTTEAPKLAVKPAEPTGEFPRAPLAWTPPIPPSPMQLNYVDYLKKWRQEKASGHPWYAEHPKEQPYTYERWLESDTAKTLQQNLDVGRVTPEEGILTDTLDAILVAGNRAWHSSAAGIDVHRLRDSLPSYKFATANLAKGKKYWQPSEKLWRQAGGRTLDSPVSFASPDEFLNQYRQQLEQQHTLGKVTEPLEEWVSSSGDYYYDTMSGKMSETRLEGMATQSKDLSEQLLSNIKTHEYAMTNYLEEHPEMRPPKRYEESFLQNPKLLTEPKYWLYEFASVIPYALPMIGVTILTGSPVAGVGATLAGTTPLGSYEIYRAMLDEGATPEQATQLALPLGIVYAAIEGLGSFPLLKMITGGFSSTLTQTFVKTVGKDVFKNWLIRGGIGSLVAWSSEIGEEGLQEIVINAARKTIDDNVSLIENVGTVTAKAMVGMLPFAIGGGVTTASEARTIQEIEKELAFRAEQALEEEPMQAPKVTPPVTPEVTIPKEYQVYQGTGVGKTTNFFTTNPDEAVRYAQGHYKTEPIIRIYDVRDIEKRIAPQGKLSDLWDSERGEYSYTELSKIPYKEFSISEFQVAIPKAEVTPPTIQTGKASRMTLYRGVSEVTPFDKGWFAEGETWGTQETAQWYAEAGGKGQVLEANIKLTNPYVITVTDEGKIVGNKALEGVANRARAKVGATTPEAEDAARKAVTNYIKRKGYNELVVYTDDGELREVVLFDPAKAKAGVEPAPIAEAITTERPFPAPEQYPALEGKAVYDLNTKRFITPRDISKDTGIIDDYADHAVKTWGHDVLSHLEAVRQGEMNIEEAGVGGDAFEATFSENPRITYDASKNTFSIRYDSDGFLKGKYGIGLTQEQYVKDLRATVKAIQKKFPRANIIIPETNEFYLAHAEIPTQQTTPERPFPAPANAPALEGIALYDPKAGKIITPQDIINATEPVEGQVDFPWTHDMLALKRAVLEGDEYTIGTVLGDIPRITYEPATNILSVRYDSDNYLREFAELSQEQYRADLRATIKALQEKFPGKGISIPETGEFFPAKVPTQPTEKATLPDDVIENPEVATRAEAIREIDKEMFTPILESKLDVAATAILKDGDFEKFQENLPKYTYKTKTGQWRKRKLIDMAAPEAKAAQRFYDPGWISGWAADITRLCEAIDNGIFGGVIQKFFLFPTRRATMAKLTFNDSQKARIQKISEDYELLGYRNKKLRYLGFDVIQLISHAEAETGLVELTNKAEIQAIVKHLSEGRQKELVGWCQELRQFFDEMIDKVNKVRLSQGRDPIPYRDNYAPWIRDVNLWSKLRGFVENKEEVMKRTTALDFHLPSAAFNPRAQARRAGVEDYLKEKDLLKLTNDYIETAGKDIFDSSIIQNAKVYIALLRDKGYESAAKLIEERVATSYAGQKPIMTRAAERAVPRRVLNSAYAVRRMLTRAVFPLNWTWNLFVQTSSINLTLLRYGGRSLLEGGGYLFNKDAKDYVRNSYSWVIKSRYGGSIAYQDLGENLSRVLATEGTVIEKGEHMLNFFTNTLEEKLTGVSIWAAYNHGKRLGLEGRELQEYASNGGSKTQSMYNLQDLPGVLQNKPMGTLMPFQTFAFEVFNTAREIGVLKVLGKTGEYQTIAANSAKGKAMMSTRLKMLAEFIVGAIVINTITDRAIHRKVWSLSSFIPFWAMITGGVNAGNPMGVFLPWSYTNEFWRGARNILEYGNFDNARKWLIRYHMPAGTQANRIIDGLIATVKGKVSAVDGDILYKVEPDEWLKSITMGTTQTRGGREYIDKLTQSKGGIWYELLGFNIPDFSRFYESKKKTPTSPYIPSQGKYDLDADFGK